MIVVEGPDGAGKTTLVKHLCKQFNLKEGQRASSRDELYKTTREDSWKALHEECMATQPPLVWDRLGPWSDPIYAVHSIPHAREPAFTAHETQYFHMLARDPQFGVLVLCLPGLDKVLENIEDGHQLPGVKDKTRAIYNSYRSIMGAAVGYNYTQRGGLAIVEMAVAVHLKHRQKREQLARDL